MSLARWIGLAALVGCGGTGTIDSQDRAEGSLQELRVRSAEPLAVHTSPETGSVSAYGVLSVGPADVSAADAREFLRANGRAFQVETPADLELTRSFDSPGGRHFVFTQKVNGVPVDGAEVKVHYDRAGRVVAVSSSYAQAVQVASVKPSVSADLARELAYAQLPASALTGAERFEALTDLVISTKVSPARLAWKVAILTDGPTWEILVDAQSGQVLAAPRDTNRYAGTGKIWIGANAVVATHDDTLKDNSNSATAVPASAYQVVSLPGLTNNGFLDGAYASSSATKKRVSSSTNDFLFDRSSVGFEETMGYFHIDDAERYIQSLGFTNVNNRQQVFSANGTTQDNSWYTPNNKQITYGTGGVDDAEDAEVIVHEYGHSVQDNQVPGFGSGNEAGAQGEGFGDYLAATVNARTSGGFQDTCIMEWDATFYSTSNPPCLRRLDSTKHYPESLQNEVHADGEMWSSTLWQIRTSIGAARADKAIIQHHFLLSTSSSFNASSDALVTAAKNLGYTSTECNAIKTALQNRGFTVTAVCP